VILSLVACRKGKVAPGVTPAPPTPDNAVQIVAIIHGVGNQHVGYSAPMTDLLHPRMVDTGFREVLWSDLGTFLARSAAAADPELRRAEEEWKAELAREEQEKLLEAARRREAAPNERSPEVDPAQIQREYATARGYVGPILQYEFLSRAERARIQARLRAALDSAGSRPTYVVAHSLGSVIAFDVLHGWEGNDAPRNVKWFFTLGSPLNKFIFRAHNGRPTVSPPGLASWTNVYSPSDPIASPLETAYAGVQDRRIQTSSLPITAHSAYWTHPDVIGLFPAAPVP
jgi:hypothetical protein